MLSPGLVPSVSAEHIPRPLQVQPEDPREKEGAAGGGAGHFCFSAPEEPVQGAEPQMLWLGSCGAEQPRPLL